MSPDPLYWSALWSALWSGLCRAWAPQRHAPMLLGALLIALLPGLAQAAAQRPTPLPFDAEAAPVYLIGAEIRTAQGPPIAGGVIELRGTRIAAVSGPAAVANIPPDAQRIDLTGKIITPGLIAADTGLGLVEIDMEAGTHDDIVQGDDPIRSAYDAASAIHADSALIAVNAIEGITSSATTPATIQQGGLLSGRIAWIDLVAGDHRGIVAATPIGIRANLGHAVNGSRAATLLRLREVLDDAEFYRRNRDRFDRNQSRRLVTSRLDLQALAPVLQAQIPLVVQAHRASDLLALADLAEALQLRVVVVGGTQAWKVAPRLAQAQIPVILQPSHNLPQDLDRLGARLDNAALLSAAGVEVGIAVLGDAHNARNATQEAGLAIAHGLDPDVALRALTLHLARAYGTDHNYGSLTPGKVANLVVWSGDPFELAHKPVAVWIRGRAIPMVSRQTRLRDRYLSHPAPEAK